MRSKIAIVILMVFCFAEITPLLPYLDYLVNYQYISKVICTNRDKPVLSCKGKCYLSQQFKEALQIDNQDKETHTLKQERIPKIIYVSKLPKVLKIVSAVKQYSGFDQFSIKNLSISPPTPPPKC